MIETKFEQIADRSSDAKERCLTAIVVLLAEIKDEIANLNRNLEDSI